MPMISQCICNTKNKFETQWRQTKGAYPTFEFVISERICGLSGISFWTVLFWLYLCFIFIFMMIFMPGFFSKNHYLDFVSFIHKLSYDTKFFEYVGDKHKFLVEWIFILRLVFRTTLFFISIKLISILKLRCLKK